MAKTEVRSGQIKDGEVKRADLNTATSGQAVITKLIAGPGITIDSSTGADSGTGDVTISSSGGGSSSDFFSGSVQTTDASATTLLELDVPADEVTSFTAIVAANGPSDKNYWIKIDGGVRRNTGGNATLIGTPAEVTDSENTPTYSASAIVSGNFLRIQVTGASAETVDWDGKIVYSIPSSELTNNENRIQYYDHTLTWTSGTTTGTPKHTVDITHNVGRAPDKVIVYIEDGDGDWYEHTSRFENTGGVELGWDCQNDTTLDHLNVQRVRLYTSLENAGNRNCLIRLIWFPMDEVTSTTTTGLKTANLGKTSGVAFQSGVEIKTGDTYNGKDIYVKEIDVGALPNATTKNVAHGIATGIDDIMPRSMLIAKDSSTNIQIVFQQSISGSRDAWYIDGDVGANITIATAQNRSSYNGLLTLYYTKP